MSPTRRRSRPWSTRTVDEFGRLDILVSNAGILIAEAVDEFPAEKVAAGDRGQPGRLLPVRQARRPGDEGAGQRRHHPDQLQVGQEGQLQELGLRGQQVRRHRPDPEHRAGAGRVRRARQRHLPRQPARFAAVGRIRSTRQYAKKWGITEEEVRQKYIDQVPMKRGCTYDDVTNVVVFLASDQSSYMTGQAINVTGGQEMS